jgi:hypothetical protein
VRALRHRKSWVLRLRQSIALPIYATGLLLDYLSDRSAALPPGSPVTTGRDRGQQASGRRLRETRCQELGQTPLGVAS